MYDSAGYIHDYLKYYMRELKTVCDYLILTVNGDLHCINDIKDMGDVDEIFQRPNEGLDVQAYMETIQKLIERDELYLYDEIVLSNDTLFGPFISFSEIFEIMEKKKCDVWGLNINPLPFCRHIQSFFYCFRNNTIDLAISYWSSVKLPNNYTKSCYVGMFELGLSNYLQEKGKDLAAFADENPFDVFDTPQYVLKYCNFPFMKKSIYLSRMDKSDIIRIYKDCVGYIMKNFNYPVIYIKKYLKEKYEIDIEDKQGELNKTKKSSLMEFVSNAKNVYLYGIGEYGQMLFGLIGEKCIKGFIDGKVNKPDILWGKPVYDITDINNNSFIVVAMSRKNTEEVKTSLRNYENVYFLWND